MAVQHSSLFIFRILIEFVPVQAFSVFSSACAIFCNSIPVLAGYLAFLMT